MAPKRKLGAQNRAAQRQEKTTFDPEETFADSQDEFTSGRDKILLDEEPTAKRRRKIEEQERDLLPSDEEVLRYDDSNSESDSFDEDTQDDGPILTESNDYGEDADGHDDWGTSKADYYNADIIETEADALEEEKEARRLQQKQVKNISVADFGFDEQSWVEEHKDTSRSGTIIEKLPEIKIPIGATKSERAEILHNRYPEFQPLAKDFIALQAELNHLYSMRTDQHVQELHITKLRALSSYLGAIAMYMAVLASSTKQKPGPEQITAFAPLQLREHSVINNLITSKQAWESLKQATDKIAHAGPPANLRITPQENPMTSNKSKLSKSKTMSIPRVSKRAESSPMSEASLQATVDVGHMQPKGRGTRKSKKKPASTVLDLKSLLEQSVAGHDDDDESDFGDEGPLTEEQLEEKARKKKSLRFYTSQIAQKSNRRGAASREAGGDDDVPRKERLRDRQERLMKEAEKRGQQAANELEQLGGDEDAESLASKDGDVKDDYYQSTVAANRQKKATKQARADAFAEAAKLGAQVYTEEEVGPDGKRAITYAIEKNKGLMPKRKKEVRNPRVKKRMKYDEKKKKLGSMRQVYKGGEGRGGYGGELTGIKTNVVKSVKL